jgi:aminoglycoside 6-adenylyltransferase
MKHINGAPPRIKRDVILQAIIAWANDDIRIRAAILTGSLARNDGLADELSDIDVELIANDPGSLMSDPHWIREIAQLVTELPLNSSHEQRWPTRLAIYSDGTKVDYTLASPQRLNEMASQQKLDPLYERGYRVLLDKAHLTSNLPAPVGSIGISQLPSNDVFRASVEEFWFEATHVPKYLLRGELWLVKQRDHMMKTLLLRMLEWHAITTVPRPVEVWHIGTRMRQWVDQQTWDEIQHTFGRFDAWDAKRAFDATVALYSRLGKEVADAAGLEYPYTVEDSVVRICSTLLAGLGRTS